MPEYADYYLRFTDSEELTAVYRAPTEDDPGLTYPDCAVDVVGLIVETPAIFDADGNLVTEAVYAEGWHVNARCSGPLPEALVPFEIAAPATPAREWGGESEMS